MSEKFLTSANAIFTLTVSDLWNAPITLENWATDRGWESEAVEMVETRMSMDGFLNAGYIPRPVNMSLTLSAASSSIVYMEAITTAQRANREIYRLGAELTIPSLGKRYTFVRGILVQGSMLPNAGATLEDRTFNFTWQNVLPAGI